MPDEEEVVKAMEKLEARRRKEIAEHEAFRRIYRREPGPKEIKRPPIKTPGLTGIHGIPSAEAFGAGSVQLRARDSSANRRGGGRKPAWSIHGDKVKSLRGDKSQGVFARLLKISVDTLQRAENGDLATDKTIKSICNYAKRTGAALGPQDLKKTSRTKPQIP